MTTALSLFAGAGGFDQGARMAGLDVVASIEREELPAQALTLNGFHAVQADVTTVDFGQWRGVDVVFGGPPCQGHSIANSRQRLGTLGLDHLPPAERDELVFRAFLTVSDETLTGIVQAYRKTTEGGES